MNELLMEVIKKLPLKHRENLFEMAGDVSAVSKYFLVYIPNFSFYIKNNLTALIITGYEVGILVKNDCFRYSWDTVSSVVFELAKDGLLTAEERHEYEEKQKRKEKCEYAKRILGKDFQKYETVFSLYLMGDLHPFFELPDGSHDVIGFIDNLLAEYELKSA